MSDLNRIRPFGGNQNANGAGILNLDEIRIGSTWADVTPFTPEPGSPSACSASRVSRSCAAAAPDSRFLLP